MAVTMAMAPAPRASTSARELCGGARCGSGSSAGGYGRRRVTLAATQKKVGFPGIKFAKNGTDSEGAAAIFGSQGLWGRGASVRRSLCITAALKRWEQKEVKDNSLPVTQTLHVKVEDDMSSKEVNFSRRKAFSIATLSLFMAASSAQAKDVPLFGIKKQLESAKKVVDSGVEGVTSSVQDTLSGIEAPSISGFSPTLQAGALVGAEVVAVVVASSVVSGFVNVPTK